LAGQDGAGHGGGRAAQAGCAVLQAGAVGCVQAHAVYSLLLAQLLFVCMHNCLGFDYLTDRVIEVFLYILHDILVFLHKDLNPALLLLLHSINLFLKYLDVFSLLDTNLP
jgi:hypothetical protein